MKQPAIKEKKGLRSNWKKPGPKPMDENEKLTQKISFRVTKREFDQLADELAPMTLVHKFSMGDLLRMKLFAVKPDRIQVNRKKKNDESRLTTLDQANLGIILMGIQRDIRNQATNINQVVKKINSLAYRSTIAKEVNERLMPELERNTQLYEVLKKYLLKLEEWSPD